MYTKLFAPLLERQIEDRRIYEEFDFSQVAEVRPVRKVAEHNMPILYVCGKNPTSQDIAC
jgi:hypothetical protein